MTEWIALTGFWSCCFKVIKSYITLFKKYKSFIIDQTMALHEILTRIPWLNFTMNCPVFRKTFNPRPNVTLTVALQSQSSDPLMWVGSILWGAWKTVQNFMAKLQIFIETKVMEASTDKCKVYFGFDAASSDTTSHPQQSLKGDMSWYTSNLTQSLIFTASEYRPWFQIIGRPLVKTSDQEIKE